MNIKNFLICLVGLPSSGKSIFANLLKSAIRSKFIDLDVKQIDPDLIRNNISGNKFDYEKEHLVRHKNLDIIRTELEKGKIVISDDLNYYSSMRHDLKQIADDMNVQFFIVYISTPYEICIKWNEKRGKPIPNEVITKVNDKFDKFDKYNWDYPLVSYNLSEITDINESISDLLIRLDKKLKGSKKKEERLDVSNVYNEKLDKLTRILVKKLLLNPLFLDFKKKIIKLRRGYVKENKNKVQTEMQIQKNFKNYLEENLKIKII